ncbi:MAG: HAMP domain-containing sensor histidine kinase [Phycisphaerae bacterium]
MRPSLTRRLLLLTVAAVLATVAASGVWVWFSFRAGLIRVQDESLRAEGQMIAGNLELVGQRVEYEPAADSGTGMSPAAPVLLVVDAGGRDVVATDVHSAREFLRKISPSGEALGVGACRFRSGRTASGEPIRMAAQSVIVRVDEDSATADVDPAQRGAWVIVGRSLTPINQSLAQLAVALALAAALASAGSLVCGLAVARFAMKPVRTLAHAVRQVDHARPELRLERERTPVELEPIVRTVDDLLERVRGELARQRQLTADVAHDLRTPVAGVRTLLDVCLQRERSTLEYVAALEKARAALRQLSALLDDVLTLSRLDAGVDQPLLSPVPLAEALDAAVTSIQPLAAAREVTIRRDRPAETRDVVLRRNQTLSASWSQADLDPLVLHTDRAKLVKILSNLLSNAVEHSPQGGVVTLSSQIDGDALLLCVVDQGPGVPAELRGRIFDRFVRADTARGAEDGHHGLGLPIAAGLARLLGGEVSLDAAHVGGSRFVVRLPMR